MKIAIASGKGGTGKTTLSVNLASWLALQDKVVLVDLDTEEPNSGIFLKLPLIRSIIGVKPVPVWQSDNCLHCGKCQGYCQFHAIISLPSEVLVFPKLCHSCYACSELCPASALPMLNEKIGKIDHFARENLTFIEGKLDVGQEMAVPLIKQAITYTESQSVNSEWLIFDSPPGNACPMIEATKVADFIILISEPTPFGLYDLSLSVQSLRKLNRNFGVVINREGIGNSDLERYCLDEDIPVIARIPQSRLIAESYSAGKLVYHEDNDFLSSLKQIKDFLQNDAFSC
ncbi:MAG: ATP-binding protein [Candidatus Cloacimonetes bacterium]|nr:ATP-binding protein [Candidatus Cloacimonadota bacterium]